jgi:outer membrane protein
VAVRRLTLDDALQVAEGGSEQVAAAEAGVRRASGEIDLVRSGLFPQLGSALGYQRTLQTQFDGIFDTDATAPPCADLTVTPDAPLEERVAEIERFLQCPPGNPFGGGGDTDLPFGQLNTWTASLQFVQRVYDGGSLRAQERQARAGRDAATFGVTTTRAQLDLDVAIAFYDAALSDRLVAITESTLTQASETLRQIELQFQVGQIAEFEVLRARVSRDNQRAGVIRTRIQRDLAYLRLKQLLDIPADEPIELDANLTEPNGPLAQRWAAILAEAEAGLKLVERTAVKQTEAGVQANEAAVDVTRADFMPRVNLGSSFTAYAYDPLPAFNRRDWTVGATVSLPILDGGRRKANRAIAQATLDESREQLQEVRELAEFDQRSAHATWQAARAAWESTAGTVQEAQRAYQIADVRYREGLSTQLELNDARLALERAEATRAQAARDLQVTRSRLALLPDLPIGAGSGGAPTATAVATGNAQPTTGAAGTQAAGTTAGAAAAGGATQTGARQ